MKFWRALTVIFFVVLVFATIKNYALKQENYQLSDTNASLLIENFALKVLLGFRLSPPSESIPTPLASGSNPWLSSPLRPEM